jgi:hypothetical protein
LLLGLFVVDYCDVWVSPWESFPMIGGGDVDEYKIGLALLTHPLCVSGQILLEAWEDEEARRC